MERCKRGVSKEDVLFTVLCTVFCVTAERRQKRVRARTKTQPLIQRKKQKAINLTISKTFHQLEQVAAGIHMCILLFDEAASFLMLPGQ